MAVQTTGLLSPYLRDKRIEAVKKHISGKVLDYGCGVGKLCDLIDKENYIGVDIDEDSINEARKNYPEYKFFKLDEFESILEEYKFNTIVSMAVIEHVKEPSEFLIKLKELLDEEGEIVLTTPHPSADWIHDLGSKIGLFSSHANEEHEELIDENKMKNIAEKSNLAVNIYEKFLFGVNQLIILRAEK